ncbi:hypothetical protein BS47DRAFT_1346651 [Hydnum rufescens UP504]|uniref:cAMP-independent regulatory protein pac2 n=1 Tax=Hydnum rufescens UP504 TaxID=1448309 RepID=A0A9P6DQV0_9AGAM|nr:hypothetical protein BS47DRAFT_1346651 [Hydnum rufescens UP504]
MSATHRHVTHPCLHIKNAHDAHVLFEAVRVGHLPMIRRRLTGEERSQLRSGEVFVWEEAVHKGGLERWTDGRKWSASRMREPFLFYEEKCARSPREKGEDFGSQPSQARSTRRSFDSDDLPLAVDGLTKQTYSAWVTVPSDPHGNGGVARKKWHMTAYFSSASFPLLPSVQEDPLLRQIHVPPGVYETGKGLMRKTPTTVKNLRPDGYSNHHQHSSFRDDTSQEDVDDDAHYTLHPYHHSNSNSDDLGYRPRSTSTSTNHSYRGSSDYSRSATLNLTLPPPHMSFTEGQYRYGATPLTPPMSSLGTPPYPVGRGGEMKEYFPFSPSSKSQDSGARERALPYQDSEPRTPSPPHSRQPSASQNRKLSPVAHLPPQHYRPSGAGGPTYSYDARSEVDLKALGAFRVVL